MKIDFNEINKKELEDYIYDILRTYNDGEPFFEVKVTDNQLFFKDKSYDYVLSIANNFEIKFNGKFKGVCGISIVPFYIWDIINGMLLFILELFENSIVDGEKNNDFDNAIKPTHYITKDGTELFEILENNLLGDTEYKGALKFNVYKYLFRYQHKNGIEDLRKASTYLNKLIKFEESKKVEYNED